MEGFAAEYLFLPQGGFKTLSLGHMPPYLIQSDFESFAIYAVSDIGDIPQGTIEKPDRPTRSYALKIGDEVVSSHSASFFSSGIFFDSLKDYEVLDSEGRSLGRVEGKFSSRKAAEFFFYDAQNNKFATAQLANDHSQLIIHTPDREALIVCTKTFQYDPASLDLYPIYYWTVRKPEEAPFDGRFLWPFLAFISEIWWKGTTD